ncbi:hypothetical protein PFICI_02089 [Pestalotiopsis fici W106-1]|uniref:Alpha/beta hydrolase fold-3 domain-containing protein n=1 Tax=Pestalotiopsis fici (strain W106-1 / CGMCC3.15140) TaxID=1229662 RepID=W3XST5_PESFW|nr:uncharacterized protein PFICI_02089 [Pestalotiopsis fici W106-1]ETS88261.1 hypothetical protein PFICI_02089 [Pestalotiopsis fici W106-1]
MANLSFNTEFLEATKASAGMSLPVMDDPKAHREMHDTFILEKVKAIPHIPTIKERKHEIVSIDGTKIAVHRFEPSIVHEPLGLQPAAVYVHGGGLIAGSIATCRHTIEKIVQASGIQIFAVEYRLAPEHPFPAAVEDVSATIQWLQSNATSLHVDPARIGLFGSSAGGGIAAGAALLARDKPFDYPIARLILQYPMLDDRTTFGDDHALTQFVNWNVRLNDMGWRAYLGGRDRNQRDDKIPIYAAPGRAQSLEGLPPTYVEVGGLDLFRDETIAFVAKLARANIDVEFHLYPGVTHGFESIAPDIRLSKESDGNRERILKSL